MRIAHITDLHVFSLEGVTPRDFLNKRWMGGLNLALHRGRKHQEGLLEAAIDDINRQGYEHLLVTGDLTNLALEAEFRRARRLLERAGDRRRVTIIPGNHDAYTADAVREQRFERVFADYLPDPLRWPIVRELEEVTLVAATTAQPTPWGFASGRIGSEQRAKIEAALAVAHDKNRFRLLALHHPPVKARGSELRQLSDRAQLCASLARYGCDLVVHGHDHRNQRTQIPGPNGPIPIYGAPSVTYADERPDRRARYNVYVIAGRVLGGVESRDVPRA
jgi:3',5'-cyclic AMP phosphodiesterase CpdA